MHSRLWLVALIACGDPPAAEPSRASPLESGIARELTARFGAPVTTRCAFVGGVPFACEVTVADQTLPVAVAGDGAAWAWQLDGRVVATAPITAYVDGVLADLGVAQTARCGQPVVRVPPGTRIACALSGGGTAFVALALDGTTSLELALDPAVARIRAEPAHDPELVRASRALERVDGDEDDDGHP